MSDLADVKKTFYSELQKRGQDQVFTNLGMMRAYPVDSGTIGDFPWFFTNTGTFNLATWKWLSTVFQFKDGYLYTAGDSLTTDLFNTYDAITATLSASDQDTVNKANLGAASQLNTLVADWETFSGPIPSANSASSSSKASYIVQQMLTWSPNSITLNDFQESTVPGTLLSNAPLGSNQLITDLQQYLTAAQPASDIMSNTLSLNAQIANLRRNLNPAPTAATAGWMSAVDSGGNPSFVPILSIDPGSTNGIINSLFPTAGGTQLTVSMTATRASNNMVKFSASGNAGVAAWTEVFGLSCSASAQYDLFNSDASVQSCTIDITLNGITKITPLLTGSAYDVGHGTGWWAPRVIAAALHNTPSKQSGYTFSSEAPYNYDKDGNFGILSTLVISQRPVITMKFNTNNVDQHRKMFDERSDWQASFFGVAQASGHREYYSSTFASDDTTSAVTITMNPPQETNAVPSLDQKAYVVAADVVWPGEQKTA